LSNAVETPLPAVGAFAEEFVGDAELLLHELHLRLGHVEVAALLAFPHLEFAVPDFADGAVVLELDDVGGTNV